MCRWPTQSRVDSMFQKIANFVRDVRTEMSKVSWPTRDQLKGQTLVVIFVSLFFAVFIFAIDHLLSRFMSLIY
jgi:preprotein translocase subunit SecE